MADTQQDEIRGVEVFPQPQASIQCVDCETMAGEEEIGGYFMFRADVIRAEIDAHGWHVIDNAVVCDECAYKRDQEDRDAA